ncbi:MAG: ROK family protein [Candidatus Nezhaarchaeales archaeon]
MDEEFVLGIDVGATRTRICLGTVDGMIHVKYVYRTVEIAPDLSKFIINEIKKLFSEYIRKVIGIGIASIGPLDLKRGVILSPPNAPFRNVEIVSKVRKAYGLDAFLINDAVAAAWAEKVYGLGRSAENLVYITLSTGIGAGVIVDDNLLIGKDGNAHEVGHIVIDSFGLMKCGCGGYGHWEAYCSGANAPRFVAKLVYEKYKDEAGRSALYGDVLEGKLNTEKLFEYAKRGDGLALKIVKEEIGKLNAAGIASVINCYDPEIVFLGGAIALNNEDLVLKPILRYIDMYATNRKPTISLTCFGEDVVLKGAIAVVVKTPRTLKEYYEP